MQFIGSASHEKSTASSDGAGDQDGRHVTGREGVDPTRSLLPGEGVVFTVERHPDRAAWLAARTRGIGGSDAAALWSEEIHAAGQGTRMSPLALYEEKRGLREESNAEELEIGTAMEPAIADLFSRRVGLAVSALPPHALLRRIDRPWMFVSPDRIVGEGDAGLECKWRAWRPDEWAQHAMAVTGWARWYVAGIVAGKLRWKCIERSESWIKQHAERCADLWRRVEQGEPPPADGHDATGRALRLRYPRESGETIALPIEADDLSNEWEQAKRERAAADRRAEAAANRLRALLGAATCGHLPSGRRLRLAAERNGARVLRLKER
jgi:predicted phage-related endonuclease